LIMTRACHFDVLVLDEEPYDVDGDEDFEEMLEAGATVSSQTRAEDAACFAPPTFRVARDQDPKWRTPVSPADPAIVEAASRARRCFSVVCEQDPEDGRTLVSACMSLAGALAVERDGIVIDRTSGIAYTAEEFDDLTENAYLRDMIVIEAVRGGDGTFEVRSRGMSKFSAYDFVVERVSSDDVELAKTILCDNVARYAAFSGRVEPGQTMQYQRNVPESIWFFEARGDGTIRVVDCDPQEKRALPDLSHCLRVFRPLFAKAREG